MLNCRKNTKKNVVPQYILNILKKKNSMDRQQVFNSTIEQHHLIKEIKKDFELNTDRHYWTDCTEINGKWRAWSTWWLDDYIIMNIANKWFQIDKKVREILGMTWDEIATSAYLYI